MLAPHERRYLAGFLAGLESGAAGVPVLPSGAPFSPEHALWVNGTLAGLYSRAPATDPAAPAADTATPDGGPGAPGPDGAGSDGGRDGAPHGGDGSARPDSPHGR